MVRASKDGHSKFLIAERTGVPFWPMGAQVGSTAGGMGRTTRVSLEAECGHAGRRSSSDRRNVVWLFGVEETKEKIEREKERSRIGNGNVKRKR